MKRSKIALLWLCCVDGSNNKFWKGGGLELNC